MRLDQVPNVCPSCQMLLRVAITKPDWPHMFAYVHLTCDPCKFEYVESIAGSL